MTTQGIRELSSADVAALAEATGVHLGADDLPEVTHRLNAFLAALAPLAALSLDGVEPVPAEPPR